MNSSLDFLNMIKNSAKTENTGKQEKQKEIREKPEPRKLQKTGNSQIIAVIDTETNWHDEVMSIGVAIADVADFKCIDDRYYIFDREMRVGGIYSYVLHMPKLAENVCSRDKALAEIREYLDEMGVRKILAYNAKFDYGHLPELTDYEWYDIMRLAAYKQYNAAIPDSLPCCKTGRLKSNYGVEPMMRLLSGDQRYCEVHNAVKDAVDELRIVELLGHSIETYDVARILL